MFLTTFLNGVLSMVFFQNTIISILILFKDKKRKYIEITFCKIILNISLLLKELIINEYIKNIINNCLYYIYSQLILQIIIKSILILLIILRIYKIRKNKFHNRFIINFDRIIFSILFLIRIIFSVSNINLINL